VVGLDVLGVMIAPADDDEILASPHDIELVPEQEPKVANPLRNWLHWHRT
jgi:hypothetical protein